MPSTEHTEAFSLFKNAIDTVDYIRMIAPPLLAFAFGVFCLSVAQNRRQQSLCIVYLGFTALTFVMASIYARYFHYAQLAACPWLLLAWLMGVRDSRAARALAQRPFAVRRAGTAMVPDCSRRQRQHYFGSHVLLFPAKQQNEQGPCDMQNLAPFLDARYGPDTLALVPMYVSDRFLFHTHLRLYFLANFPSGDKFVDARFFTTRAMPLRPGASPGGTTSISSPCAKALITCRRTRRCLSISSKAI